MTGNLLLTPIAARPPRSAFTLTEVLISIALVLILILGVNQVFSLTGRAVGAGQALSEITRQGRAAQKEITRDLEGAEFESPPFIWIDSTTTSAFRNREAQFRDRDYATTGTLAAADRAIRTFDRNENGSEADPGDLTPRAFMTPMTHRTDRFAFFTREINRRQTGNSNSYSSTLGAGEMYVVYGHLLQPTDAVPTGVNTSSTTMEQFLGPGIGKTYKYNDLTANTNVVTGGTALTPITNPNNFYATQWMLGRVAYTMSEAKKTAVATAVVTDSGAQATSLVYYTHVLAGTNVNPTPDMHPVLNTSRPTTNGNTSGLVANQYFPTHYYDIIGEDIEGFRQQIRRYIEASAANRNTWFNLLDYRFIGSPRPTRPLTRDGVARTVPCFVPACTQFAIEYAGDFLNQDPTSGAVLNSVANTTVSNPPQTDGEIDYIIKADPNNPGANIRAIRWYGFPRDVNGDGKIVSADDVVPLRDIAGSAASFERVVPPLPAGGNYGVDAGVALGAYYRCAWGPDTRGLRPKMIRITMAIDDPSARIASEQYFQFVVNVP